MNSTDINQRSTECSLLERRQVLAVNMQSTNQSLAAMRFPFKGLMAPVFTPFDDEQNVNLEMIRKYSYYLHSNGVEGILVNGTVGEGMSLTVEERMNVLETWIREAKQCNLTIVAQIGGTNMKDVKKLASHAEKCKVAGILCLPDLYYKPSSVNELIRYLNIVAAEAPHTPLLYYHIPSFTGINLNMKELLDKSAMVPTLTGIKFTDNDLVTGSACLTNNLKQNVVFLGADLLFLPSLFLGFDSAILTTINIFPTITNQILKYFNNKEYEKAAEAQQNLNNRIQEITENGPWVSSMKAAMNKLTPIKVGPVRDPLINVG